MKKIIAILLAAMLLAMPVIVMAGFEEEANAYGIAYTINAYANKPALDGQVGELSYTQIPYVAGDISYAWDDGTDNSEAIAKGHDFQIYATYDASNIYVLVSTDTNNYHNDLFDGDGNAWQYSVVQWNFAAHDDFGSDRLEFGTWRNSDDGSLGSVSWAQHPAANEFIPEAGSNYTVALRDGRLWYEVVVPVNTFLGKDTVSEGDVIGLCLVMGQTIPGGSHIHSQFASGCTGDPGKDAERFAKITLGPAMEIPAAPAEPSAAAPAGSVAMHTAGTIIGSEKGWDGDGNGDQRGAAKAFDNDPATFFDPAEGTNPEHYAGVKMAESFILTEIRILPRDGHLGRFNGAAIWGFNGDVFDPATAALIWESDAGAEEQVWQIIPASAFNADANAGFTSFVYFNQKDHGDVAEIELYGFAGGSGGGAPAAPAPAAPAPTTSDPITLIVLGLISAAGITVAKKRK